MFNTAKQLQSNESQKVANLQVGTPTTIGFYGVKVQVNYRVLLSQAIQSDPVLRQLLEALDGLVVP